MVRKAYLPLLAHVTTSIYGNITYNHTGTSNLHSQKSIGSNNKTTKRITPEAPFTILYSGKAELLPFAARKKNYSHVKQYPCNSVSQIHKPQSRAEHEERGRSIKTRAKKLHSAHAASQHKVRAPRSLAYHQLPRPPAPAPAPAPPVGVGGPQRLGFEESAGTDEGPARSPMLNAAGRAAGAAGTMTRALAADGRSRYGPPPSAETTRTEPGLPDAEEERGSSQAQAAGGGDGLACDETRREERRLPWPGGTSSCSQ